MRGMLVALLSCLVIIVGCAPAAPQPPASSGSSGQPAAEKKAANQVIKIAQSALPPFLGPECCVAQRNVFRLMFDMLVVLDKDMQPVPQAAERWEWIDPLTVRFYLRKDLTFSNGDKLTADDVEYTVNYFVESKTPPLARFPSIAG